MISVFSWITHTRNRISNEWLKLPVTEVSCWTMVGERQSTCIRSLYLEAVLKQDISFFDVEMTTGEAISMMSADTVLVQDALGEKVINAIDNIEETTEQIYFCNELFNFTQMCSSLSGRQVCTAFDNIYWRFCRRIYKGLDVGSCYAGMHTSMYSLLRSCLSITCPNSCQEASIIWRCGQCC
jgi:hypothetical protein